MTTRWVLAVLLVLILSACSAGVDPSADDCAPSIPESVPVEGDPDRSIEDIIEAMTGEGQVDDVPVEDKIDDPNFGGVYGDQRGGIIVAVVDCSNIDVDELARIAGGSAAVSFVEVEYSWREVEAIRDRLVAELREAGVPGDVSIESTPEGRRIEVRTPSLSALPSDFGATLPDGAFTLVETDDLPLGQ